MYQVQEKPHAKAVLENGAEAKPLVTLVDEGSGTSHIIMDDGCFVLINGTVGEPNYKMSSHWYPEAARALATYLTTDPAPSEKVDELDERLNDPDLYHDLSVPFSDRKSAAAAAKGFHEDLRRIRALHRIPDVIVAWRLSTRGQPGAGVSMGFTTMGDELHTESMAAWLFGKLQADRKQLMEQLLGGN